MYAFWVSLNTPFKAVKIIIPVYAWKSDKHLLQTWSSLHYLEKVLVEYCCHLRLLSNTVCTNWTILTWWVLIFGLLSFSLMDKVFHSPNIMLDFVAFIHKFWLIFCILIWTFRFWFDRRFGLTGDLVWSVFWLV